MSAYFSTCLSCACVGAAGWPGGWGDGGDGISGSRDAQAELDEAHTHPPRDQDELGRLVRATCCRAIRECRCRRFGEVDGVRELGQRAQRLARRRHGCVDSRSRVVAVSASSKRQAERADVSGGKPRLGSPAAKVHLSHGRCHEVGSRSQTLHATVSESRKGESSRRREGRPADALREMRMNGALASRTRGCLWNQTVHAQPREQGSERGGGPLSLASARVSSS